MAVTIQICLYIEPKRPPGRRRRVSSFGLMMAGQAAEQQKSGGDDLRRGAMRFETYEDITSFGASKEQYCLQQVNDLLEQVEALKAIDTSKEPKLQILVSSEIRAIHEALSGFLF